MEKENSKKGTKHIWWLTIVMIILLIATGLGGYLLGASKIANEVVEQKENVKEKQQEEKKLEITEEVKGKIERFIRSASVDDSVSSSIVTANYFNTGVTSITKEIKLKMAYNDSLRFGNPEREHKLTKQEVEDMEAAIEKNENGISEGELVTLIKISNFDSAYEEFFKEKPNYTLDDIKKIGCPLPWGLNKDLGVVYLFSRCGGSGGKRYNTEISSYEIENEYYVVKQKAEIQNPYENKTEKSFTLIWKFDKDLKFVSTTVE